MSIITLTTDYGLKDYFVGALKGKIYAEFAAATIVDISHDIFPFNLFETSYIIGSSYSSFPIGTVHIIGVDMELSKKNKPVVIVWNDHYFIAADNGVLSLLMQQLKPDKIYEIDRPNNNLLDIDLFVKTACHIANNGKLDKIGIEIKSLKQLTMQHASVNEDSKIIRGIVIYIDNYGNAITNITKKMFLDTFQNNKFEINFKNKNIKSIFAKYSDVITNPDFPDQYYDGHELAIFNTSGFLEIALYKSSPMAGSAKTMFNFNVGDVVTINLNK